MTEGAATLAEPPADAVRPAGLAHPSLDDAALGHLVGYRLARADVPARRAFMRHVGVPLKLRPVEFSLLVLLLANGSASAKQLAQSLDVPPPQVTMLVDRMADRGLVVRGRSARDGRAIELRLTAEGEDLARRAHRVSETMEASVLQPLSPAERAMLFELLAKLARG
jgi:DNA-binding MarR family transcriptional regulator